MQPRVFTKTCKSCNAEYDSLKPQQRLCNACLELTKCSGKCGKSAPHNKRSKQYICRKCSNELKTQSSRLMLYIGKAMERAKTGNIIDCPEDVVHIYNIYQSMHIANGLEHNWKTGKRTFKYHICHRSPVKGINRIGRFNKANTFIGSASINLRNRDNEIILPVDDNSIPAVELNSIRTVREQLGEWAFQGLIEGFESIRKQHREHIKKFDDMFTEGAEYSSLEIDDKLNSITPRSLYDLDRPHESSASDIKYRMHKKSCSLAQVMNYNISIQDEEIKKAYQNILITNKMAVEIENVFFTAEQNDLNNRLLKIIS